MIFFGLEAGRTFGWIVFSLAFTCYTAMTARDYTTRGLKRIRKKERSSDGRRRTPNGLLFATFIPPNAKQREIPQKQSTFHEQPSRNVDVDGQLLVTFISLDPFLSCFWG